MLKPFIASILSAAAMAFSGGKPLRIAYPSGINGQLAKVIEKAGFAEKHGFAPTFTFFQYGPPMIEALAAGEVDVILTSFNPTASFLAKKPGGLVIIADVGSAKHAVVVPGDSPAKTLADLKGKSIAVSFNSDLHVDVVKAIKDLGLDPAKDYKLLNVPPQELAQTFDQKLAEAVDIRIPPLLALQKKSARIVAEWPWQLLVVASDAYLAARSAQGRRAFHRQPSRSSGGVVGRAGAFRSQGRDRRGRVEPALPHHQARGPRSQARQGTAGARRPMGREPGRIRHPQGEGRICLPLKTRPSSSSAASVQAPPCSW
jgi:hypothetical protein